MTITVGHPTDIISGDEEGYHTRARHLSLMKMSVENAYAASMYERLDLMELALKQVRQQLAELDSLTRKEPPCPTSTDLKSM